MRLVVACPQCKRRYDVGRRPIGSRFRCQCGAVVTIRQQHNPDGAEGTPERLPQQKTAAACPACGRVSRLAERKIGEVAVLECGRCAGLWLGTAAFEGVVERASQEATQAVRAPFKAQPNRKKVFDSEDPEAPRYRQCPVCGKLMNRQNYGRRSGVVVDICRTHGAWFDADELPRILDWVRSGNLAAVRRQEVDESKREERRKHALRMAEMSKVRSTAFHNDVHGADELADFATMVPWLVRIGGWFL